MLLALWIPWAANAATEDADAEAALQALLGALDQETKIATHTKMNIDFVPGMVSVLYGKDLQDRGVRTAGEALSLIPGVELSLSSDGQTQVFVRGIGTAFSSGKIKVLLNGVPFNSTLSVATTSLHIPVEQIDRIEVIRGPGSTIYGEFAYSGVVNVVTRKQENNVFVRYGDLGSKTIGMQLWKENAAQNLRVNLNFSGTNIEGDAVESGPDILRAPMFAAITRAPGPTNEKEHDRNAVFQLDYKDFNFMVQWSKVGTGDAFGLAYALPDPEPRIMRDVDMLSVQAEQHWALTSDLNVRAHMGWLDYSLKSGLLQFYPPGFAGINPMTGQPFYPDGLSGGFAPFDVTVTGPSGQAIAHEKLSETSFVVPNANIAPVPNLTSVAWRIMSGYSVLNGCIPIRVIPMRFETIIQTFLFLRPISRYLRHWGFIVVTKTGWKKV